MNRVFCILALSLVFCKAYAEPFVLAFHRSPPYSDIAEDGQPFGMDLEISTAVSQQAGIEIVTINCPLARCLQFMKDGEADLTLGLIKTDERESFMSYVHPPYYTIAPAFAFYKRKGSDVSLKDYSGLRHFTIAVTRGGVYFSKFDQDQSLRKVESLSIDKQLNLLTKDRVDLVIGVESTLDFTISSMGLEEKVSKTAFRAYSPISAYMAVSRKSGLQKKIPELSEAILSLKQTGQLGAILGKYNIRDIDLEKRNY